MSSRETPARSWRTRLRKPILVVGMTYAFVILLCLIFEDWLIYQPLTAKQYWGDKLDPRIEDVTATSADGTKLHAWWLPPTNPEAGAVLYCHGNGGNVSCVGPFLLNLQSALDGDGALALDYPGYGKSEGSPTEMGCNQAADAFWDWLTQQQKIDGKRIVLLGESLGGGIVADLASRTRPRALVLLRTYATLPTVAKDRYSFLPAQWLMRTRFDSTSKLARVSCPVLVAHGTEDTLIRPYQAQRLYDAAREPKTLHWMQGMTHNEALPREFYTTLQDFLATKAK